MERESAVRQRRAEEVDSEMGDAQARIRKGESERERYARDLEWFNDQLVARTDELTKARAQLAKAQSRLSTLSDEVADVPELRNELAEARKQQRRWAREARRLERSRSWRLGRFLTATLRLLTFRRLAPPGGLGDLATSIESYAGAEEPPSGTEERGADGP